MGGFSRPRFGAETFTGRMCTAPPVLICIWSSIISSVNQDGMYHWDWWFAFWWWAIGISASGCVSTTLNDRSYRGIWGQLRFDLWCCDRSLWVLICRPVVQLRFCSVLLGAPQNAQISKIKRRSTGKTGWPGVMNNRFFGSFMKSKFMFKRDLYLGCISDEAGIWDSCLNDPAGIDPTGTRHCLWHCLR